MTFTHWYIDLLPFFSNEGQVKMTSTSTSPAIPTISYSLSPNEFSKEILHASIQYGFFYLTDAPIDWKLVDRVWKTTEDFFLNEKEEEKLASRDREGHTGYTALQEEKLDPNNTKIQQGDLKESFYIAQLNTIPKRQTLPPLLEKKCSDVNEFFEKCQSICSHLLQAIAKSIQLDDDHSEYFSEHHTAFHDRLRLIHYPPTAIGQEDSGIRAGAHTDYGSLTLLFQHKVSGLQIWKEDDENGKGWLDVEPVQNSIVVNIADALEFWTNGKLQSVQHRVVMPRNESESVSRFSIAYFCQPDEDAVLDPVPLRNQLENIQRRRTEEEYELELKRKGIQSSSVSLTGGQHLLARLKASYT